MKKKTKPNNLSKSSLFGHGACAHACELTVRSFKPPFFAVFSPEAFSESSRSAPSLNPLPFIWGQPDSKPPDEGIQPGTEQKKEFFFI